MKLIVYRNYNCTAEMLLEKTNYEVKTEKLKNFLKSIKPDGGWGHEAIEVCYQNINKD